MRKQKKRTNENSKSWDKNRIRTTRFLCTKRTSSGLSLNANMDCLCLYSLSAPAQLWCSKGKVTRLSAYNALKSHLFTIIKITTYPVCVCLMLLICISWNQYGVKGDTGQSAGGSLSLIQPGGRALRSCA